MSQYKRSSLKQRGRALRVEQLECRHMLSGMVEAWIGPVVPPAPRPPVAAGELLLWGDGSNNEVEIRTSDVVPGDFTLDGIGTTALELNGVPVGSTTPLTGVTSHIMVNLQGGNNDFEFQGSLSGSNSVTPGNLLITNNAGSNVNSLTDVTVSGALIIAAAAAGNAELEITDSIVIGATVVNNLAGVGPDATAFTADDIGGDTKTTIVNSELRGAGGFNLINGPGEDITQIEGASTFGTGIFPGPAIVTIQNGWGGSRTTFTGDATVYGSVSIGNGDNPAGLEFVTFNNAQVLGTVNIHNGSGNTVTTVQNSQLGTHMTLGGPLTIDGAVGQDAVIIQDSEIPWGVAINADPITPLGGVGGSAIDIRNSEIGTRLLGPLLPLFPAAGLVIQTDNGTDTISVTESVIGGNVLINPTIVAPLSVIDGINEVLFRDTVIGGGFTYNGGAGEDSLLIDGVTVPVMFTVVLDAPAGSSGVDLLEIRNGSILPDLLLGGGITILGGGGVDTFGQDPDVTPTVLGALGFEILI